ncbi:hypothetical protein [uncultured Gammaproteobacteria bacterium]|nr:hypothetical protein [uncultured Gammaproteobacteria bacterium]
MSNTNTQDIDISNNTRNGYYPKTIKGRVK